MWIMRIASIMFVAAAMQQKWYKVNGGMTWVEQDLDKHKTWMDAEKLMCTVVTGRFVPPIDRIVHFVMTLSL